jgi:hypothetical protein
MLVAGAAAIPDACPFAAAEPVRGTGFAESRIWKEQTNSDA